MDALVVGGGVSGLTTALILLEHGFRVTILSKQYASPSNTQKITSQVAGALWEWPPSVCGRHKNEVSLARSKRWCMRSYARFKELASESTDFGVEMKMSNFFFKHNIKDCPQQLAKMLEIQSNVEKFRHDSGIVRELGISQNYGIVDAYKHLAPVIDTDQYMYKLTSILSAHPRCYIRTGFIKGDILEVEASLRQQFNANLIVNCTGLGSYEAAADKSVYPLRGALVRFKNDGKHIPVVDECMVISLDSRVEKDDMVFIIPRNKTTLVVGGIVEEHQWSTNLRKDYPPVQQMLKRNRKFYPRLQMAQVDSDYPLAVGLRPARRSNVRVEREQRSAKNGRQSIIVHNYGHGGAGFTLSFGCAEEVVAIAESITNQRPVNDHADLQSFL